MKIHRNKIFIPLFAMAFLLLISTQKAEAQSFGTGRLTGSVYTLDKTTPIQGAVVRVKNINDGVIYSSNSTDGNGSFRISGLKEGIYIVGVTTSQGDFNTDNLIGIKENLTAKISFSLNPYDKEHAEALLDVYGKQKPPISQARGKTTKSHEDVWEVRIGKVVHYDPQTAEAAAYIAMGLIQLGDEIHIRGYVTDFFQDVKKIRLESAGVERALAGQTPLIGVERHVEVGDFVYLVCGKRKGFAQLFQAPVGLASLIAGTGAIFWGVVVKKCEEEEESPFKK